MSDLRVSELGRRPRHRRPPHTKSNYNLRSPRGMDHARLYLALSTDRHLRHIRIWIIVMMVGLVVSGVTAFPLQMEVAGLHQILTTPSLHPFASATHLLPWIARVDEALTVTDARYPFLAYGTDWLAFAHLTIALAFVGPWRDPVRNKWIFTFGLIACAGVIPLALIAGQVRGIPLVWRLGDCCFGIFGCIPMWICQREVRSIEQPDAH